jgi:hypothetical protein
VPDAPQDRIRKLLLSADNALKNAGPRATPERLERVRATLEEAREVAADPRVDERIRELVERRLASL